MARTAFNFRFILKFLGYLLFIECFFMSISACVGFIYHEHDAVVFLQSAGITLLSGIFLALFGIKSEKDIGKHENFVMVTMCWVLFSFFGSLPFYLSGTFDNYTDAFFESMSGFTTTGSTVMIDIEAHSHAILFWRSLIQWLGGMGIILLSLAIMPLLKLGNYQLFTAEVTGPVYDKLHPRISETAKRMWFVYLGLTILQMFLLHFGKMSYFDAICHSFTTMASGGFSTKNASIGYWNSAYIEIVTTIFMFLAGTSFVLMFRVLTGKFSKVRENEEFKWYALIVLGFSIVTTGLLYIQDTSRPLMALRNGIFHVVSVITTTGYAISDFSQWPQSTRFVLLLLFCSGAMSGSTSGNVKIGRIIIYFKTCFNELKRDVHPNAVLPVLFNQKALPASTISSLFGFLFFYIIIAFASTGIFFALGMNMEESISLTLSSLGNIGPGMGDYFANFTVLPDVAKWFIAFLMLIGRLEIYTVLMLFSPDFWKK